MNPEGTVTTSPLMLLLGGVALLAGGFAAGYAVAEQFSAKPARRTLAERDERWGTAVTQHNRQLGEARAEVRRARAAEKGMAQRLRELHNQQRRERWGDPER